MDNDQAEKSAKESLAWLETPEGREHLEEHMKKAQKFSEELRKMSQVDWKVLYQPMTI